MKNSVVELNHVSIRYDQNYVVTDVTCKIHKGHIVGIVGPNGSGKSTLMKAIIGLLPIEKGSIKFAHKEIKIGYLPQDTQTKHNFFPATVKEIVLSGRLMHKGLVTFFQKKDIEAVNNILNKLRISNIKSRRIGELSGGQIQRVLLARALVNNPEILILDEPTSALDPSIREEFYNLLTELKQSQGVTILLASHDITSIRKKVDKMLYLDNKLIFYGSFEEFCQSTTMSQYFGEISQHYICGRHDHV